MASIKVLRFSAIRIERLAWGGSAVSVPRLLLWMAQPSKRLFPGEERFWAASPIKASRLVPWHAEPGAGSDNSAISTTATSIQGNEWILNGEKDLYYQRQAPLEDEWLIVVWATVDGLRVAGDKIFVVEAASGAKVTKQEHKHIASTHRSSLGLPHPLRQHPRQCRGAPGSEYEQGL
jgi:alkylation response protein AidB-like acyl-CoA dehydrogenase